LHATRRCQQQIAKLECMLVGERARAAQVLSVRMRERRESLERLQGNLAARIATPIQHLGGRSTSVVGELLAALEAEFPQLEEANLHDFRKRVKQVRSLAEIAAPGDAQAHAQAAALKKMQVATGQWRDWQVLAAKADNAKSAELAELLEAKAGQALGKALGQCRRLLAKLRERGDETPARQN
jgi:hypothetical protein